MFMTTDDGFAPAGSSSNPRASRALVNLTDKVPLTGIGRRRRRICRIHERIRPPTRRTNATNDFQREVVISKPLLNSGTYAAKWEKVQVGRDSTLSVTDNAVRLHINPELGDRRIGSIRQSDIQGLVKT